MVYRVKINYTEIDITEANTAMSFAEIAKNYGKDISVEIEILTDEEAEKGESK